jgi:hypothetical protein
MAYIGEQLVIGVKGINDPFTLIAKVRTALERNGNRTQRYSCQEFINKSTQVADYQALVELAGKYVTLDENMDKDATPEHRAIYNEQIVPFRQFIWQVAEKLMLDTRVNGVKPEWEIRINEESYRGVELWLTSLSVGYVSSPLVRQVEGKYGSLQYVRMKGEYGGGMIMNTTLAKATPEKVISKMFEHGEKRVNARIEQEIRDKNQRVKAKRLVNTLETKYDLPRYFEGSDNLQLTSNRGLALEVNPISDYGQAVIKLTIRIGDERTHADEIASIVSFAKALKIKHDMLDAVKKEAK